MGPKYGGRDYGPDLSSFARTTLFVIASVMFAACGSSGPHPSTAEILAPPAGTTPVYTPVTSSALAQYERAALTYTTTTRDVVAFVPRSPPAQYMALGT